MNKLYSSRSFQFFAIIIIASLCLLLDSLTKINFTKIELPKGSPEYNAKGVDGSVYNKSGKLLYNLKSDFAWQFPGDKRIYMKNLHIYMYSESSDVLTYEIVGDDGWINHSSKLGKLGKHAIITAYDKSPRKTIKIYGRDINLDMNTNLFVSKENVRATQESSVVTSHGFEYAHNLKFLTLKSKVRVIYVR
jgi:LPS export ABC transporter protein LptC